MSPLLSLCIPTYGVSEWVFPVLDSIYDQNCKEEEFEVVVTDNGNNKEFCDEIKRYQCDHKNLIYKKTEAKLFLNEIESYKNANGLLIKFINHRTILLPGTLDYFIEFVKKHGDRKPVTYFANGELYKKPDIVECGDFNEFVKNLGYLSSWSTGMAIWKEDFNRFDFTKPFNELFPHTTILFDQTKRDNYLIDNRIMLSEMNVGSAKKGNYDLFYAFSVEYPGILCDLLRHGDIDFDTFDKVKRDALECVTRFYWRFVVKKEACSYDLSGIYKYIDVYFSKSQLYRMMIRCFVQKIVKRVFR